ncbi:MAG TPA: anti-sigma factor [Acidimicrobiales bacterium]|nr:anti-sigma factor [Acidimicrobiales bacterium]
MRTHLAHPQLEELLGAYALDAVDRDERDMLERHLPLCARCRAEAEEFREVAALLAHSGAPAPEGVWDRIAATLEGKAPDMEGPPAPPFLPSAAPGAARSVVSADLVRRRSWQTRAAGAVMAAAAAVIVVLGVQIANQDRRLDEMAGLLAVDALERAYQVAEASPDSERIRLQSFDGRADTQAVVTEEGVGYLWGSDLPRLEEGQTYQLWGDVGDRLVSLGLLGPDPEVVPFEVPEQMVAVAITEEAEPGVVVSEQPILAIGQLPE